MNSLIIELPESLLVGSGQSRVEFIREAKFLLMARLFELGRVSSGSAAEVCEMPRLDFLFAMRRMGIPVIQLDREELRQEIEDARR